MHTLRLVLERVASTTNHPKLLTHHLPWLHPKVSVPEYLQKRKLTGNEKVVLDEKVRSSRRDWAARYRKKMQVRNVLRQRVITPNFSHATYAGPGVPGRVVNMCKTLHCGDSSLGVSHTSQCCSLVVLVV